MQIRVCRYKNVGVAGYAEAFMPVQSDLQTSEWYSYFENDVLVYRQIDFLSNIFPSLIHFYESNFGFSSIGSERAPPCINAFTAILSILLRRRLGRSPANSLTAFAQTVPPTCQLCSQNGQNYLPNAYHTWRSPFYCIGYVT